jgi:predicted phosphoribosyltransferase
MFRDREAAAFELAERLRDRPLIDPVVLAIPRGGVVIGAVLAQELGADLDVVLARKIWAPVHPEQVIGALSETGKVYLNFGVGDWPAWKKDYLAAECRHEAAEVARRKKLFRKGRSPLPLRGRSVIVADDGIATGATLSAALQTLRPHSLHELIVAVPVIAPDSVARIRRWCDEVVYLLRPLSFRPVGQFYEDFTPVEHDQVVQLLRVRSPAACG